MLTESGASILTILLGQGTGGFVAPFTIPAGVANCKLDILDFDTDGRLDFVSRGDSNSIEFYQNITPLPESTIPFGTGTYGCSGDHGLLAAGKPYIGNINFGVRCTNAPPNSLGLVLRTDALSIEGENTFLLGILTHCDLLNSTSIVFADVVSDASGYAVVADPIPNDPL